MKRTIIISLLTVFAFIICITPAYSFMVDGIEYKEISGNPNTAYVTSKSWSSNYTPYSGDIIIPATVSYRWKHQTTSTKYTVVGIGGGALGSSSITSVTLPNTITWIGAGAFSGSSLSSITIPSRVDSIDGSAFNNCSNLSSIVVEEGNTVFDSRGNCNAIIETASNTLIAACKNTSIPNSVISIGNNAFGGCGMSTLSIPSSITSIGESAFSGCSNLTSIIIPDGVTSVRERTFAECSALTSVSLPYGVTSIGESAFSGCSSLTSIIIPNGITSVREMTFQGCTALTSVSLPYGVTSIGESAFSGCSSLSSISLPNSVTSIGYWAFSGTGITSFTFPEGVNYLRWGTFNNCKNLTKIVIPAYMTTIENAFSGCTSLENISVDEENPKYDSRDNCNAIISKENNELIAGCKGTVIPSSITSIGYEAFLDCTGLSSITIPNSVTSIGYSAFYGCTGLTSITFPNSVTSIGSHAFASCRNLTSVTFGNGVATIEGGAFTDCTKLTSVTIPESVTNIGWSAFSNCYGLTSLSIPYGVTTIGERAFEGCFSLPSVSIPETVTDIGNYAFSCYKLAYVKVDVTSPISIGYSSFTNRANATLIVPQGCKAAYEAATYWQDFKKIVEYLAGDVNIDEDVDVLDVVDIARFVVGTPSETFVELLADINKDKAVNIGDAVMLVNEIAGDQNFSRRMIAPILVKKDDSLTLSKNNSNMSLVLDNEHDFTAFQFDIFVSEETDIQQMLLNVERKQGHQLLFNKVEDGHYRVAALSTSNNLFNGNSGELLNIVLNADNNSELSICNIHFFDADGNDYLFDDIRPENVTGIENLMLKHSKENESIYNFQGHRLEKLQQGINIVGGKKVIVK